jgi:hypothetical protein
MFSFAPTIIKKNLVVFGLHDTFSGVNGSAIVGRTPDILGNTSWIIVQPFSVNGQIQSNQATETAAGTVAVAYDTHLTNYILNTTFTTTGENASRAIGIFCRTPVNGLGSSLLWSFYNGTIELYDIDLATNALTLIGTTDVFSAIGTFSCTVTVTNTAVSLNVNGPGASMYFKSVTTNLHSANTGVGLRFTGGVGYLVDEIVVSP